MFPNPIIAYEVTMMEQRELVAAATERSRYTTTAAPAQGTQSAGAVRQFLGAVLDRIVTLLPDSRDSLRSKEQELAAVGVTWPLDPVYDEMLARQIEDARLRRRVGYPAPESIAPAAGSALQPWAPSASQLSAIPAQV